MVDATYIDNNRVQVVQNDDIAFDSDRPSVVLFPDSALSLSTSIVFPSPIQRMAYYRDSLSGGGVTQCELWSTLFWQEWGPGETYYNEIYKPNNPSASVPGPTTRNLPAVALGSIPSGMDYIDVRVRLTRTTTPALMYNSEPPVCMLPQGVWITSPGGSFVTEFFLPLARHFDIVRSGTNIILNRYQSVRSAGTGWDVAPGGNRQAAITINESGWNSTGVTGTNISSDGLNDTALYPRDNFYLAGLIQRKPYDTSGNKRPGGTNPCAGGFPDFTSIYTADILVTPGRYLSGA